MTQKIKFEAISQLPTKIDQVVVPSFEDHVAAFDWISQEFIQGFSGKKREVYSAIDNDQLRSIILSGAWK